MRVHCLPIIILWESRYAFYCCTKWSPICELHERASPHCSLLRALYKFCVNSLSLPLYKVLCMKVFRLSYRNMHVLFQTAVVFLWFSKMFILFSAHYQTLLLYQVSCVGILWLVRFASSTWKIWNMDISPFLLSTKRSFRPHDSNDITKSKWMCIKSEISYCTHVYILHAVTSAIPIYSVLPYWQIPFK